MDQETWKFINTFAPWLSAIGTLAAVIVSLYLARSEKPIKLEIRAGHRMMIEQGQKGEPTPLLYIGATNRGYRPAIITNIGWKLGFLKNRYAIQMTTGAIQGSSTMPVKIDDGEEAKWLLSLERDDNWVKRFSREFLMPNPRLNLFWLRLQIHTSIGKTFNARIEKGLREELLKECMKQLSAKKSEHK